MIGSNFTNIPITHNCQMIGKPSIAFGKKEWQNYFSFDVIEEPPLPANIFEILQSQCPFSKEKKFVGETHLLVLIPAYINNEQYSIQKFGELIHSKIPQSDKTGYNLCWDRCEKLENDGKSRWVLLTKDILNASKGKPFSDQKEMIAKLSDCKYRTPRTLEVVTCLIAEYVRNKIRLYSYESDTFTNCLDSINNDRIIVGIFNNEGLSILQNKFENEGQPNIGIAALREL